MTVIALLSTGSMRSVSEPHTSVRRSEFYGDNPLYACPTCGGGRKVLVATADGAREVSCPQCGTMPGDGR